MNITLFYNEHKIPYITEGHAHCQNGWVQIACPFCTGNPGYHMGYNLQDNFFNCWRCGFKTKEKVISSLISISQHEAKEIIKRYGGSNKNSKKRKSRSAIVQLKKFKYPSNTKKIKTIHKQYIERRKFDPDYIEQNYKIMGTGPVSQLGNVDFKYRIIIPIIHEGEAVSWQSRYVKDFDKKDPRQKYKYITCPKEREKVHHKHILYGFDQAKKYDWCIVCEGILDVWRLGSPAVCTFGVNVKIPQIRLLAKFQTIFIAFDADTAGQKNAEKIKGQLEWMGKNVMIITDIETDPGDMTESEAKQFKKRLQGELK